MHPTVSILVTVYNREAYLAPCLDSILASTWKDFEVLVVDDQSKDGSVGLAEIYAGKDERVRVFKNETNLGDYPNRVRAAQMAQGKYLKYVDADDLIYPHSLAIMVEAMEACPAAALGLAHSLPEDEQPYPWLLQPEQAWRKQFLGRGCLSCGPSGAIIRRDAFVEAGGFGNWGVLNDVDLWCRLSSRWPVLLLPPGLIWWRRHEEQEFTKGDATTVYLERGYELVVDHLTSSACPLSEVERSAAVARARHNHARRLWSLATRRGRPRSAWRAFLKSGLGLQDLAGGLLRYR